MICISDRGILSISSVKFVNGRVIKTKKKTTTKNQHQGSKAQCSALSCSAAFKCIVHINMHAASIPFANKICPNQCQYFNNLIYILSNGVHLT